MNSPPARRAPSPGGETASPRASLGTVLREWGRIGVVGFGGPPAHIALLRDLVVDRHRWLDEREFEDANAACSLLPGPASTQMAIYCASRAAGRAGAILGGLAFILPGLVMIVALAAASLGSSPPRWLEALAAGAGGAVVAVVLQAGFTLARASLKGFRSFVYLVAGIVATVLVGPYVVLVLLACGAIELGLRHRAVAASVLLLPLAAIADVPELAWTALKVGALSYGGGFVIIPLIQADAVDTYGWMTNSEFLDAVAFGQVTPGPVTHTVAVVGYAAAGLGGALIAATIAFLPSFLMILIGGRHFDRIRESANARAFLDGAGPAAIGAIIGAAVPLADALVEPWQFVVAALALAALLANRAPILVLLGGVAAGLLALAAGADIPT